MMPAVRRDVQRRAPMAVADVETHAAARQRLDGGRVAPGGGGQQACIAGALAGRGWRLGVTGRRRAREQQRGERTGA
jgi:hypothetical protein